jgi:hypothetical protein
MKTHFFAAAALLTGLTACTPMQPEDFVGGKPELTLEGFFPGHERAYGVFYDRGGSVKRQFTVDMNGSFDGAILHLEEYFTYSDGEHQERHWRFRRDTDGTWIGTAPDVIGEAHGRTDGNAFELHYTLDVKSGDSVYRLDVDDWLFREASDVILDRAVFTKFGFMVGQLQLVIIHAAPTPP